MICRPFFITLLLLFVLFSHLIPPFLSRLYASIFNLHSFPFHHLDWLTTQRLVASSFYELGVECQSLLASRSASMAIPLAHPQTTHLESPSGPRYHQATSGSWLNKHRARLGLGPSHSGIFP